jgi:putative peptidoglycan binding protein
VETILPVSEQYKVEQGDCISSIAFAHGFFPDTIWNHPDNSQLKQKRKDPNVLMVGDVVAIPDKEIKEVSKATEQKHRFRKKGVPAKFKVRVLKKGQPRKNEKYRLIIDGQVLEGSTDGDGFVEKPLPPNAQEGKLILGEGERKDTYVFHFGHVDPLDTDEGVAGRLHNLGYSAAQDLPSALKKFQSDNGLQATGRVDDATRNKLKEKFGQ